MAVLLGFAFASGVITILSPCILPVLPALLAGSVGGRARPYGVLMGFVLSFGLFTLALTAIVRALGVPADTLRLLAVGIMVLFGLVMLVPSLRVRFELLSSRVAGLASALRRRDAGGAAPGPASTGTASLARGRSGLAGGLAVGLSLGLVWTPCVGPIMASVMSLALTQAVDGGTALIALAYALGTAVPMLAVMQGGRALLARVPGLARRAAGIQRSFGVLMIAVGVAVGLGWDRRFQAAVLRALPGYGAGLTAVEDVTPVREALKARAPSKAGSESSLAAASLDGQPRNGRLGDYGPAPALVARGPWYNTERLPGGTAPQSMEDLRGRVVLIDFWTYSCVNCVRTVPHLQEWDRVYGAGGLVIIGVHTPEFEFERSPDNVARAVKDLGVSWPVVLDNDYAQWTAYDNRYWPAHYFIDSKGRIRYFQFGEGGYEAQERVIRALLMEAGPAEATGVNVTGWASKQEPRLDAGTPETYLGYSRARGFVSATVPVADRAIDYRPAREPGNGEWNLEGRWTITREYVVPDPAGVLQLGFRARKVFLVVEPMEADGRIEVRVDGLPVADTADVRAGALLPRESRLYELVSLKEPGAHVLRLEVRGRLRLFAFTFG